MADVSRPLTRTMASAPRPEGVETATIVRPSARLLAFMALRSSNVSHAVGINIETFSRLYDVYLFAPVVRG